MKQLRSRAHRGWAFPHLSEETQGIAIYRLRWPVANQADNIRRAA